MMPLKLATKEKKQTTSKSLSFQANHEKRINRCKRTCTLPLVETRPSKRPRYANFPFSIDHTKFVEKEMICQSNCPKSMTMTPLDADFKKPTGYKKADKDDFVSFPSAHIFSYKPCRDLFDQTNTKSKHWKPTRDDYDINVGQDDRMPSLLTASQQDELTAKKLEEDTKLLRRKKWQLYSLQKLLHKYPGYVREYQDHNEEDPLVIPFKHRKTLIHSLRHSNNDDTQTDAEMVREE